MNIKAFIKSILDNGGASYNLNTGELNPSKGYFVSNHGSEEIFEEWTPEDVRTYINKNAIELTNPSVFLGAWIQDGVLFLDCSAQILDKKEAINSGFNNFQQAIYNANEGVVINLPTLQECGTETQKQAYKDMKVRELCS